MLEIYEEIRRIARSGRRCAIGLVVQTQGSTPQKAGAMAVADDSGRRWGTLGGGLVEAQALERLEHAIASQQSEMFEYRLDEHYRREAGPICGGVMRILTLFVDTATLSAYEHAIQARSRGNWGALVTFLGPDRFGTEWISEQTPGVVPDDVLNECLREDRARCVTMKDGSEVFIQPFASSPRLLVVGGGHVGQEVVRQAVNLGFSVTLIDDRAEYASPELFPTGVDARHGNIRDLVAAFPKGPDAFIVLVSKGHRPDAEALEACIHDEVAYLGMIGSERKIRLLRRDFLERELATAEEFDRIVAPIGVDIGAITVPEIGVSVAAQLVAARRKGMPLEDALRMRFRSERAAAARDRE